MFDINLKKSVSLTVIHVTVGWIPLHQKSQMMKLWCGFTVQEVKSSASPAWCRYVCRSLWQIYTQEVRGKWLQISAKMQTNVPPRCPQWRKWKTGKCREVLVMSSDNKLHRNKTWKVQPANCPALLYRSVVYFILSFKFSCLTLMLLPTFTENCDTILNFSLLTYSSFLVLK